MKFPLVAALAAISLFGQPPAADQYSVIREGAYWVRIDRGILPPSSHLKVMAPGAVQAQGEWRSDIGFVVKRRVRAKDFATAKRLLAGVPLFHSIQDGAAVLAVSAGLAAAGLTELELHLPRTMTQTSFYVQDGTVSATDLEGAVFARAQSGSLQIDRIMGDVIADTGGGEIRLGRVSGAIRCHSGGGGISVDSAGARALLETAGGEVFVREAQGPVIAVSGGGNIQVVRAHSSVDARTNGGLVEVNQSSGQVRANTTGGAIHVGAAKGAQCESAAGTIFLNAVSGGLRAATRMGSIIAGIQGRVSEDSFLQTAAGDITVFLPSTLAVTVQADNLAAGSMGRIFSDFPEIRFLANSLSGSKALGSINGGGPVLRISAAGGTIHLKRKP